MESCLRCEAVGLRFGSTPVQGGFLCRSAEDVSIGLKTECFFRGKVVVDQKMPRQIDHGQSIGPPDAGGRIDIDWYVWSSHGRVLPKAATALSLPFPAATPPWRYPYRARHPS